MMQAGREVGLLAFDTFEPVVRQEALRFRRPARICTGRTYAMATCTSSFTFYFSRDATMASKRKAALASEEDYPGTNDTRKEAPMHENRGDAKGLDEEAKDEPTPRTTKKQRTNGDDSFDIPCLLLQGGPNILQQVYSFLTLQEAMVVRGLCHELHNNDYSAFRFSHFLDMNTSAKLDGASENGGTKYFVNQGRVIFCSFDKIDMLRAILANETLTRANTYRRFMIDLIRLTKTDNGEAVSALLEFGKCTVEPNMLDEVLRKGYTAMGTALLQNEQIAKRAQKCDSCYNNIGCYECLRCKSSTFSKYCRPCVLYAGERVCSICKDFCFCQECFAAAKFPCHGKECQTIACFRCLNRCRVCATLKCDSCIKQSRERWRYSESGDPICPYCSDDSSSSLSSDSSSGDY